MTPIGPTQLGERDLKMLLFQPGDLPAETTATHADDPMPLDFEDNPPADQIAGLRFERDGRGAGSVTVLLYRSLPNIERAYGRLARGVSAAGGTPQPIADVGGKAMTARLELASSTYGKGYVAALMFTRCHALIDIRLNESTGMSLEMAVAFAKRLDQRLVPIVCSQRDE